MCDLGSPVSMFLVDEDVECRMKKNEKKNAFPKKKNKKKINRNFRFAPFDYGPGHTFYF